MSCGRSGLASFHYGDRASSPHSGTYPNRSISEQNTLTLCITCHVLAELDNYIKRLKLRRTWQHSAGSSRTRARTMISRHL